MLNRTQILFPDETLNELRRIASYKNIGLSQLVRDIVNKDLRTKKRISGTEAMLQMAKRASKDKAPKDLSFNDDYLYKLK